MTRDQQPPKPLDEYYRQYLGVVIGDKRLIYVNLFPHELVERSARIGKELQRIAKERGRISKEPEDWRTTFMGVCDGGAAFWTVLFDPRTLQLSSPRFNGHI